MDFARQHLALAHTRLSGAASPLAALFFLMAALFLYSSCVFRRSPKSEAPAVEMTTAARSSRAHLPPPFNLEPEETEAPVRLVGTSRHRAVLKMLHALPDTT